LRFVAAAVFLSLLAAACADEGDQGDPEAFCELLVAGVGQADGDVDPAEFQSLAEVAPREVRGAVDKLGNTAADVETLDHSDLEALFDASFDPDASEARRELESYAVEECDIPVDQALLESEMDEFLAINFADARWLSEIEVVVSTESGIISGIEANFLSRPLAGEAVDVCRALAVYMYEVSNGDGPVTVTLDEKLLVSRQNREATCQRP
jgi:hypothetical protein